ncbi:MAG: folate-binding protein [Naasia sp.]
MSTDPLLALPGAVAGAGSDDRIAAHFGNPIAEQRALVDGRAVVRLPRGVVTVTGDDRLSWLDSLTSQRLTDMRPGESRESLLLDPQGHVEHDLRVADDGETAWIITESGSAEGLARFLDRMRFMLRVEVADRSQEWAVLGAFDAGLLAGLDPVAVWRDPWAVIAPGGVGYSLSAEHPGADWTFVEAVVPLASLGVVADRIVRGELRSAGALAVEALRIAAWRPRLGAETDERSIPHELDWLRSAVHLAKGCYRGQETVAKVHNLGHPPRRLVLLDIDGSDGVPVASGDLVFADRRGERVEVGRVTSSGNHYERGPIALAVIKRTVPSEAVLTVVSEGLDIAAAQEVIVPVGAGRAVEVPRMPRVGAPPRA